MGGWCCSVIIWKPFAIASVDRPSFLDCESAAASCLLFWFIYFHDKPQAVFSASPRGPINIIRGVRTCVEFFRLPQLSVITVPCRQKRLQCCCFFSLSLSQISVCFCFILLFNDVTAGIKRELGRGTKKIKESGITPAPPASTECCRNPSFLMFIPLSSNRSKSSPQLKNLFARFIKGQQKNWVSTIFSLFGRQNKM